jgi:hypothetical protein
MYSDQNDPNLVLPHLIRRARAQVVSSLSTSMFDIIFESPASTVYKTLREFDNRDGSRIMRVMAVKTGSCAPMYSPEPHDIVKEARILSRLVHPNVSTDGSGMVRSYRKVRS